MLKVHSARFSDIVHIADNMRDVDLSEVTALGSNPHAALTQGIEGGVVSFTAVDEDETPVLMFGVSMLDKEDGAIWLLGTDDVKKHARSMVRDVPLWLELCFQLTGADKLYNIVWVENATAIRWLSHAGAIFEEGAIEYGGLDFYRFEFRKENHTCAPSSSLPSWADSEQLSLPLDLP